MLARMLGANSQVAAPPEPHLLTPLAHLGYYESVERAPYDPITVARESRPTTESVSRWQQDMAGDPGKVEQAAAILARLTDEDLASWGFDRGELEAQLAAVDTGGKRRARGGASRYKLERKLLVVLRRNIHHNVFGRLVRRVRNACDILLR